MGYQSSAVAYDAARSVNSATLSGSFMVLGSPLTFQARIIKIVNNSGVDVTVSTDGVTTMDFVPKNGFTLYDLGTNRGNDSPCFVFPSGTQFYVNGTASTGLIYLICLYGAGTSQTPPL